MGAGAARRRPSKASAACACCWRPHGSRWTQRSCAGRSTWHTELVTDEIQSLRHLIVDLRPRELDEVGLEAAIERLAARVETIGGPDVKTRIWLDYERARHPERLVADIETAAYRIVQEALNNAVKHALARSVHVDVIETGGTVRVRVCDDGRGFDMRVTEDGLGLVGMRERAALVGGSLNIHSSAAGTTVELDMPAVHAG